MVAERIDLTKSLVSDLNKVLGASNVDFDHMTRTLYSTDASNYQMMPIGVTFPRNADDVVAIQAIANQYKVPLLPRGGGTGLAGQTVNEAVVMDFSRHMRRVRGVNAEARTVTVEPGLVLGVLNRQMASLDLMFGPDPASGDRATVGGGIGNNSTGAHSIRYGMTADNISRLQVVLPSGELLWLDENNATLQRLRETVSDLVVEHKALIDARYPKTWRTVAGYALNKIDPDDVNLNWLFAGAEGTLGTVVQAELDLVYRPRAMEKRLAMVHFDTLRSSLEATPRILELDPEAVELIDKFMLDQTRVAPGYRDMLWFVEGDPASVLIVEFVGENAAELTDKVDKLKAHMHKLGYHGEITVAETSKQQDIVWTIRKAGLGLIMSERNEAKPLAFVEDASVPVENLADYITEVDEIIRETGTTYAIYAHASAGCLHVRPLIDLKTLKGRDQYRTIAERVTETVVKYQGTITGEHGDGIVRAEFGRHLFGEELLDAFRHVKRAFDPDNLLNPGKVIDAPAMDDPKVLRYTPEYEVIPLKTRHDWSADNGFAGAIEMCNGAGVCRKEGSGTMCPSYMATYDEAHSTRGRANALRAAISGRLPDGIGSEKLKEVFDLCLSCKACKSECPSSVDVARMKSEFMALYHDEHGTPMSTRVFGNIHKVNQIAGMLPGLSNFMLNNPIGQLAAGMLGLPTERPLPQYKPRFTSTITGADYHDDPDAVMIIDTFTQWNHPEVGQAVHKLANALGAKINFARLPQDACCGRPAMSKGMLDTAKKLANTNVRELANFYPDKPLLFVEPSCMSAMTDDYVTLVDPESQASARRLASRCVSAEAWLLGELTEKGKSLNWDDTPREIMLHGHCHQKALWGTAETRRMMQAIPNATVTEIDSGCCGVAGSFGYEHYELSMKIANDRLLPAIEANPDAIVAAPGTSCRAQIHDAGHGVQHPVEVVANALRN